MKKVLTGLSLALMAMAANADAIASSKINDTATLFLFDDRGTCTQGRMQALLVSKDGRTQQACWQRLDIGEQYAGASVRYDDGNEYLYRGEIWTFTPYGRRWAAQDTSSKGHKL